MSKINFLDLEEVIAIHYDQVERYGGSHGLRDLALLMSAILRPQASFAGKELYKDVFEKTAALMHSLIMNHAFVDGNKRTAMVAGVRFLYVNGYYLKTDRRNLVDAALKVEAKRWNIEKLSSWLKNSSKKV